MKDNQLLCHCGSLIRFEQCCKKFIHQTKLPKTAEQLMRSRFTAFKLKEYQYIIDTHQSEQTSCPTKTSDFDPSIQWMGLKVISISLGGASDSKGSVEFVAFYRPSTVRDNSKVEQLHEKSDFTKVNGYWLYVSGIPMDDIKLARNEVCFCGSGKKHKKCHGV